MAGLCRTLECATFAFSSQLNADGNVNHLMNTYARLPVAFTSGAGVYLHDTQGQQYFDALTGIAVVGVGHANPRVAQAIGQQASALTHTSNLYEIPLQTQLADRLCTLSGMERAFFANSGAEANEAALKLARLKGHKEGIKKPTTVVMDGSFHGRTMATLTATGNRKVHAGFEPLLSGFVRAPYNDIAAIEVIAKNNSDVVAILVEPVLGEGGIQIPDNNYLTSLRTICDQHNWLLMLDEVQSGNARTGQYFAYQHSNCIPDVVTTAKGLGNGMPIGVCLARGEAAQLFAPGNHGSTFGGNPLACAAANAVLDEIEHLNLCQRAGILGQRIVSQLHDSLAGHNEVKDIRGHGLMIAVELNNDAPDLVKKALDQGLLINVTQGNTIRLLPPLTMTDSEAEDLITRVTTLLHR